MDMKFTVDVQLVFSHMEMYKEDLQNLVVMVTVVTWLAMWTMVHTAMHMRTLQFYLRF